jgi:hypothetical protein
MLFKQSSLYVCLISLSVVSGKEISDFDLCSMMPTVCLFVELLSGSELGI